MKPKTLSKKLTLNKSTVADLNGNEMIKVKGGCYETSPLSFCTVIRTPACPTYLPALCPSDLSACCPREF